MRTTVELLARSASGNQDDIIELVKAELSLKRNGRGEPKPAQVDGCR